jgi:hypothetical protein
MSTITNAKASILLVLLGLLVAHPCLGAQIEGTPLIVANFDKGVQNHLEGYHNEFERSPSSASVTRVLEGFLGLNGKSLRIVANKKKGGFCGAWIQFFNFREQTPSYFDASQYKYLSIWIKGKDGGEKVSFKLADRILAEREDAYPIGNINSYLESGITKNWQQVLIPLAQEERLNLMQLATLVFDFKDEGKFTIFVDDIAFLNDPNIPHRTEESNAIQPTVKIPRPRALWVWETESLLKTPEGWDTFFEFLATHDIQILWLQLLLTKINPIARDTYPSFQLKYQNKFRSFIKKAYQRGIEVEALEGYPEYALAEHHHIPLSVISTVISFNKKSKPDEQFTGIHFDNEPHLLIGWHDPAEREKILHDFLTLITKCKTLIQDKSSMTFGVDIPFWWQEIDPATHEPNAPVQFNGTTKAASYHVIDTASRIGIMNYRNTADGADGIIAHGKDLLDYAEGKKGVEIFLAVETFGYDKREIWFASGMPMDDFKKFVAAEGQKYARLSRMNEFKLHSLTLNDVFYVGVEIPEKLSSEIKNLLNATMIELAQNFGSRDASSKLPQTEEKLKKMFSSIAKEPEWSHPKMQPIHNPVTNETLLGFRVTRTMLPKTTFAHKTLEDFNFETNLVTEEFNDYKNFSGIAIHNYQSFKTLAEDISDSKY